MFASRGRERLSVLRGIVIRLTDQLGFPGGSEVKASACNAGDLGLIPGSGRSPGRGNGNPLQYSCLENSMDGEALWATVHGVAKSLTQLSDLAFTLTHQLPGKLAESHALTIPLISYCGGDVLN